MNKRQITYGSNTFVSIILVFAALLMINMVPHKIPVLNFFGMRIPLQKEFDLTSDKRFSLTDETVKTLHKLNHPVKVIAFAQFGSAEQKKLEDVLKRYSIESNDFTYRIEDPERNPVIAEKYGVKSSREMIIENGTDKPDKVDLPYSVSDAAALESRLTGALLRELNPKRSTVYFVEGHGERALDDQSTTGLSTFKQSLTNNQYDVKSVRLYGKDPIPADASAIILAGPTKDLLPEEIDNLNKYLTTGGRLLVLSPPPLASKSASQFPNLEKFLSDHGINLQNDIVVSATYLNLATAQRILIPLGYRYENHPITDQFREMTVFPVARSLQKGTAPQGSTVQPLVWTTKDTIEYADPMKAAESVMETQNWSAAFNDKTDKKGEAMLGAAITIPIDPSKASPSPAASSSPAASASPAAAGKDKTEARMVVFSDVDFISKPFFELGGNEDLAINSLAWLTERTEQIAVKHAEQKKSSASLSEEQKRKLSWLGMPFMPCFVGIVGLFVHMAYKRH